LEVGVRLRRRALVVGEETNPAMVEEWCYGCAHGE